MTDRPVSTYRLQVRAGFDLDAAAAVVDYLADLGVDWVYLSPILQATAGSDHGYDVVDPTRVDADRGGAEGLARLSAAARARGLGVIVDIVPNHQGVAVPAENPWWWDVLTRGRASPHAVAFDIDWDYGAGRVVLPVLGGDLETVLAARELTVSPPPAPAAPTPAPAPAPAERALPTAESALAPAERALPTAESALATAESALAAAESALAPFGSARYYDLVLPLAEGTAPLHPTADPAAVRDVLARQCWRLENWRDAEQTLNYRRFFTVTSLAGVCVEDAAVFDATHAEVLRWLREGLVDGLRIDHPDGLTDPGAYLDRLAAATGGAYVVVEKILEPGEELPGWWATDGTTGYDALGEIDRVLTDPAGEEPLTAEDTRLRGGRAEKWAALIAGTKRDVADTSQAAEVGRLVRCLPASVRDALGADTARDALAELLAAFPVYRAYLPAGGEHLAHAVEAASARRPDLVDAFARLVPLVAQAGTELSRRFMQTTGPVMAKGVEDRAFYRFTRLGSLTEVGGDPARFALDAPGLHAAFAARQAQWPAAMTTLTTHDTKRSEDVRTRLAVLAELPERWSAVLDELRGIASTGDGAFDALLWQAIIGSWPSTPERLHGYAEKAAREAGVHTTWTDPDAAFETRVRGVVDAAFGPARPLVDAFSAQIAPSGWSNALSAKLLQLTGPGVPDVYQGTELWDLSLVDPDNRRAVDFDARRGLLARLDDGWLPPVDETGAAKLLLVSRALRLRRDRPELFTRYTPLPAVGAAAAHALAFDRGGAVAVATRLPVGLSARGGWGDTALVLPAGRWLDAFTGAEHDGGPLPAAALLHRYPVALLTPAP